MPKPYTIFPDHSSARLRAAWLAAALVALMLGAPEATRSASAQEIGTLLTASPGYSKVLAPDELLSALQKGGGSAPVIVNLKSRSKTPKTVNWKDKAAVAALKSEAKAVEDQVIAKLDPAKSKIRHQFPLQAGFSCEITEDALAELLVDPLVNSVEPVQFLEPHLRQGIPLMNGFEARASFDGSGVAVAICDTGVDVNHPKLGGGGFPNAKVVAGFDYGNNDGDPRPGPVAPGNAHGTSVAAITAGDPGSVGDYIGGVAPKALIVAYKISTDADNLAPNDAIIAAWNNAAERNTLGGGVAGGVPIVAMNTSFGGGQFFANCDGESAALTDAADAATGAGITLFVSSGNNGFCSSMASPACLSQVISVGAVYDANIGAPGFCISQASCLPTNPNAGCPTGEGLYFEPSTKADQVTAYSNSALFLGLLAPSHNAYTADIVGSGGSTSGDYTTNFGGTSAAAPYATGAAAIIQSAALELLGRLLSVDELTNLILDTGDDITDQRNSLTTPRVNIGRAIEVLLAEEPTPTPSGPSPTPTPFVDCNTIFPIRGEYFDPENDVTVDLYMEPFSKFIALANEDVEQASDPERIREDALSIPAYIASQVLPPNTQTLEIATGIFLPEGEGFLEYDLACAQLQPLVNNDLLLFGEPYVILAVYSDLVPRSGDGVSPPEVVYFGTFSPGTFLFDPSDFEPKPSPTPTHTPLPNEVSLELDTAVDPDTELPLDPELRAAELLDISWFAQVFLPNATLTLYFDRNDHLEIRGPLNEHLRTVTAGEGQDASAVVSLGETIVNDGLSGFDFGPIDLTSDPRFPPPPPTGKVQVGSFNPDSFRWDFSQIPAGRFFIYGILDNTNGQRVVDYAPYAILAKAKRWPVLIGTAVDDRFVHGVAIHDLVTSASELDVVAVAQSGVLRVLDFLGRAWGQYSVDLDVTVDTAPAAAELDGDEELEILLGTDQLVSDENPIFANRNALLAIDANFRPKYEALRTAVGAGSLSQDQIETLVAQNDLTNAIHFLPAGHAVFHTPSIRDMDGDGVKEVLVVTRALAPGGDSLIQTVSFSAAVTEKPTVETTTLAPGAGFLGAPAVGNLDNNPDDFEVVVGSQSGRIYVFDPDSATIGAPILTLPGPTLRSAALVDVDGDG
ncbi:MAG: S8 family serine peptidase, partial [Candidatus Omnitrophica bacterium]|nr:S8 family serine peptidase [Candidatus Omnitrophota bacterium]